MKMHEISDKLKQIVLASNGIILPTWLADKLMEAEVLSPSLESKFIEWIVFLKIQRICFVEVYGVSAFYDWKKVPILFCDESIIPRATAKIIALKILGFYKALSIEKQIYIDGLDIFN